MKSLVVFHKGKKMSKQMEEIVEAFEKDHRIEPIQTEYVPSPEVHAEIHRIALSDRKISETTFCFDGFKEGDVLSTWVEGRHCHGVEGNFIFRKGKIIYQINPSMKWVSNTSLFQFPTE